MPVGGQTNTPNASNSLFLINGSIWHEGAGVPPNTLGSYPDFYIDTTTNDYYAKQCDGTWLLKGSFGTPVICKTVVINLVANTPQVVSHAEISNEICEFIALDQFNKNIEISLELATATTVKVVSNVALNNIQIKLLGF